MKPTSGSTNVTATQRTSRSPRPEMPASDACLVHIYPPGPTIGRRYPLTDRPLMLGRGDVCDVVLLDHSVSRRHAAIESSDGSFSVIDLGSTNGTHVNDYVLDGPRVLQDGDYLRVGNCLYRFLAGGNVESAYHEEIYRLTVQDGLTRTHNRRALDEFLDREVARTRRYGHPLSVLMIDLDRFKAVNDTHGHLCGDFALRELADVVRECVRAEDLFARYGGEEFALALVETGHAEAVAAAERVREAVEGHPFQFEGTPLHLTVSVGVATTAGIAADAPSDLIRSADQRLYLAKQGGRNRVVGETDEDAG